MNVDIEVTPFTNVAEHCRTTGPDQITIRGNGGSARLLGSLDDLEKIGHGILASVERLRNPKPPLTRAPAAMVEC